MSIDEWNLVPVNSTTNGTVTREGKTELSFDDVQAFEHVRTNLYELAFCILRSGQESHSAVRRTLVNWIDADRENIAHPASWLSENCLLQAIEIFRRTKGNSAGDWNPGARPCLRAHQR